MEKNMKKIHPLKQLLPYMAQQKSRVILAAISSVLNKLCDIVPEILIGIAIDVIINQHHSLVARFFGITDPFKQLYLVGGLTGLLWIGESIFEYCYLVLWRKIAQRVQHQLRMNTYKRLQQLDMAYFEHKTTGGLLTILNDDINQLENFLSEGANTIIQLTINIIVMGSIFFTICPMIAVLTVLPIPFILCVAYYFQHRLATLYGVVRNRVESLSAHIAGRLLGISTIKSYATEEYELECLREESLAYKRENHIASRVNAAYIPIVRMGILSGFLMSMVFGGYYALMGGIGISFYSVLVFLTQRFLWPFTTVTTITDMYERAMASARRIFAILQEQPRIIAGNKELIVNAGHINLDGVSFAYPNGHSVFSDLSLTIPANNTVAFVGSTGSGKSTIIKLLLRFYETTKGSISIDGLNIRDVSLASLRSAIGFVSQDIYLMDGTVAQNIAYGSPQATREEIIRAAQAAEAHHFIISLPNGYDTIVGENGKNLSGGQRQRLSIARAILKNPRIFIFDEATSALDNETEAAIQRSMNTLARDHTMIIIAHRLSTVRHANTIFVMDKGCIVESGTHEKLLASGGTYSNLWKIQTGETV